MGKGCPECERRKGNFQRDLALSSAAMLEIQHLRRRFGIDRHAYECALHNVLTANRDAAKSLHNAKAMLIEHDFDAERALAATADFSDSFDDTRVWLLRVKHGDMKIDSRSAIAIPYLKKPPGPPVTSLDQLRAALDEIEDLDRQEKAEERP